MFGLCCDSATLCLTAASPDCPGTPSCRLRDQHWLLTPLCIVQAYGEIRSLYTACKLRGFVVLSFYDLRASCLAIHALQGARVGAGNLHISFSTPKDNMGDKDAHQGSTLYSAA